MATVTTQAPSDSEPSASVGLLDGIPVTPQPAWLTLPLPRAATNDPAQTRRATGWSAAPAGSERQDGRLLVRPGGNRSSVYLATKRLLDVAGALGLLLLLGPMMLGVLLILLVTTKGRPLFWQRRAGHCGRPFLMFKFRTMALDAAERQHEIENEKDGPIFKNRRDPRITRIGRLLRKTSLDETPQLFHVLFGRMSLVGPRPLPVEEAAQLNARQRQRLAVMPGLTCLWQISGRSEIGFDDWVRLDLWYVRNQRLRTDFRLLLSTPACVLSGRGAY